MYTRGWIRHGEFPSDNQFPHPDLSVAGFATADHSVYQDLLRERRRTRGRAIARARAFACPHTWRGRFPRVENNPPPSLDHRNPLDRIGLGVVGVLLFVIEATSRRNRHDDCFVAKSPLAFSAVVSNGRTNRRPGNRAVQAVARKFPLAQILRYTSVCAAHSGSQLNSNVATNLARRNADSLDENVSSLRIKVASNAI